MKKLYLFDFDGTLTYRDTMFLFLRFYDRKKFYRQFFRHIPLFSLMKLGLADTEKVKKSFIASILKGEKADRISALAQKFFEKEYPGLIRPTALQFIEAIDRKNTDVYLVSASLDLWLQPFAHKWGFQLLATTAEIRDGIFTGNFSGKNCNGEEKVDRVRCAIGGKKYDKIVAFGDTENDRAMLDFAHEGHYRFFH